MAVVLLLRIFCRESAYLNVVEALHNELDVAGIEFLLASIQAKAFLGSLLDELVSHVYQELFDLFVHVDASHAQLSDDVLQVAFIEWPCHCGQGFSLRVHRQQIKFK